ncbi:MAG: hypothetical protein CMN30_03580 [Sandaracinus sp.]|nr:hypothetical protein [Sandaracinus sp.]
MSCQPEGVTEEVAVAESPAVGSEEAEAAEEVEAAAAAASEPAGVEVLAGSCDLENLPPGLAVELEEADAARVRDEVARWVRDPWGSLEPDPRGVVYAQSEADGGADPLPRWLREQGTRACGLDARWLLAWLRQRMRTQGGPELGAKVTCQGNVCCFPDMGEYSSSGGVVFEMNADQLLARAAWQVADNGTLGEDTVAAGQRAVRRRMTALLRGRCPRGE